MLNIIKNIFYRLYNNKIYFFLAIFIPPAVVIASLIFTNNIEYKIRLGVLETQNINIQDKNIVITYLKEEPKASSMIQGKYDAIVKYVNGKYEINTLKKDEYKQALDKILNQNMSIKEAFKDEENRGVISNLTGFLTMLILILSSMLYKFYYQEKNGIDKRILITNISYIKYVLSHFFVVFTIVFVPTIIIVLLAKLIIPINTVVSNLNLIFIIFTICMLGSSFSFFISSIFKTEENGSLISTMIILITSLLSGSFLEVSKNGLENVISHLFPQRYIVNFAINIENMQIIKYNGMILIIICSIILIFAGTKINKIKIEK